jgi:hypothetical protein
VLKRVAEDQPRAIREIIPETPQWLCDIVAKLHEKNPRESAAPLAAAAYLSKPVEPLDLLEAVLRHA